MELEEVYNKFAEEVDESFNANTKYKEIHKEFHDILEKEIGGEKAEKLDDIVSRLGGVISVASGMAGMKLGAKIATALLIE